MPHKEYFIRFNSKLVRLKGACGTNLADDEKQSFNSKLVRLKVLNLAKSMGFIEVSIPNWFD